MMTAVALSLVAALVLPPRLQTVHDAIPLYARVADVGCDHGKLSAALASSGRAAFVVL